MLQALLARIERHYAREAAAEPDSARMLRNAAEHLGLLRATEPRPGRGTRMPACRYLDTAYALATKGPLREIAEALRQAEPAIDWEQNPNYTVAVMGERFVDRYCYTEAVGIGRPFESREFLVGFILLGPELIYPDHWHPAVEVYHVLAGHAEWWREGHDWHVAPPGTMIYHAPHVRHAMRMRDEPLLALYCWGGDIAVRARLTRAEEMQGGGA
jgi:quercetin dioxygenase-like cupin family protein